MGQWKWYNLRKYKEVCFVGTIVKEFCMMDIRKSLLNYGKKNITIEALASLLRIDYSDTKEIFVRVEDLMGDGIIEPVKTSGKNGNLAYSLFKKYRIIVKEEKNEELIAKIKKLHPILQRDGYLATHPAVFQEKEDVILFRCFCLVIKR